MRGERGQHPEQGVGPSEDVGESGRIILKGHNVFHLNFTNLVFMNKKWVVTYGFIIMRWFKSCPSSCFISGGIFYFCQNCNLTLDWISYKKYVTQLKFARIWHWFFIAKWGHSILSYAHAWQHYFSRGGTFLVHPGFWQPQKNQAYFFILSGIVVDRMPTPILRMLNPFIAHEQLWK